MLADKINYSKRTWIISSRDGKFFIAASSLDLRRLNGTSVMGADLDVSHLKMCILCMWSALNLGRIKNMIPAINQKNISIYHCYKTKRLRHSGDGKQNLLWPGLIRMILGKLETAETTVLSSSI